MANCGTSLFTTIPATIILLFPIFIPSKIIEPLTIYTSSLIITLLLLLLVDL
jgi:hypothetical protein